MKETVLIIYYHKNNKYSFNALIGALDSLERFNDLKIAYATNKGKLVQELEELTRSYEKVILGLSFFTTQIWEISKLISNVKKKHGKNVLIIAGGPHPTGDPSGTLQMGCDIVVIGEGEDTFVELLQAIDEGESLSQVKGIGYVNSDGKHVFTGKRPLISLDKYPPFPSRNRQFGALEITRGCPHVCFFCQTSYLAGTTPRHRSVKEICKHVRAMKQENLTDIRFITPNAFCYGSADGKSLNLSELEKMLSEVREIVTSEGRIFFGSFPSEVRPEHVTKDTLELLTKYADNDNIIIGAQSGSQKVLDSCHRGHTIEDVYTAVELTLDVGLKANVDFIFGLPNETSDDIAQTITMMEELAKSGARIHAHSFIPLPMTPFAKESVKPLDETLLKSLKSTILGNKVFGEWKKQEQIALKLAKYLKTREHD